MKTKTFTLLVLAAAAFGALAVWAYRSRESATAFTPGGSLLLPELASSINDVQRLVVRTTDEELVLALGDEGWTIENRGGYPATFDAVKTALVGLSRLETREPKTSKPELYGRLGVADVDAAEGAGTFVSVEGAGGAALAALLLGETRYGQGGGGAQGMYVREAGDAQTWLVDDVVEVSASPTAWADTEILSIPMARVVRVEVVHPDGERLVVSKADESDTDYVVEGVPLGRELASPRIANPLAGALGYLSWTDVRPASEEVELEGLAATFTTIEGLRVTVRARKEGEVGLLSLSVGVDEDQVGTRRTQLERELGEARALAETLAADREAATEPVAAGEVEDDVTAAGEPEPLAEAVDPAEDPEAIAGVGDAQTRLDSYTSSVDAARAEAETLAREVEGWVFEVSSYKIDTLDKRLEDMLAPEAEPEDSGPPLPEGN